YFDLRVEPDQEQELNIRIYNHEDEELTVTGEIFNATTSSDGTIIYGESEIDSSLSDPVTDQITFEDDKWTIPAGESINVTAKLNTPAESFDGIKLGGMYFEKAAETETDQDGVNI